MFSLLVPLIEAIYLKEVGIETKPFGSVSALVEIFKRTRVLSSLQSFDDATVSSGTLQ